MKSHSETEENYLKAIYRFSGKAGAAVSTNTISKFLETTPASVTDMLKRLNEKNLVVYQPYKGVRLSESGTEVALKIIRKHRLWELFLVKVLNFSWDAVHDTAEQLEHVNSPELIQKLDEFLGFPKYDPHGDPIPDQDGRIVERSLLPLSTCPLEMEHQVASVSYHAPEFLQYLDRVGLNIGASLRVLERYELDNSVLLAVEGRELILSGEFSKQIMVHVNA